MKQLAVIALICAAFGAQNTVAAQNCPLQATVAATNVPLHDGEHLVVWFQNVSNQPIKNAQVQLSSSTESLPSSQYSLASQINSGQAAVLIGTAQKGSPEGRNHHGGVQVAISQVTFADGNQWKSADRGCTRAFLNADYEPAMRRWNAELRAEWNRNHPEDPMPEPRLAAWLHPESEGWR